MQAGDTYWTALISDSCPVNVCTALPVRISQTFAVASQDPDTNRLALGASEMLSHQLHHLPVCIFRHDYIHVTHLMTSPV